MTDRWSYDAFGNEIGRTGNTQTEHLYRGEQFDPNLGFYYLRARYYDAVNGRFPTMDTYAGRGMDPASLHKYLYAHADPANNWDPTGWYTMQDVQAAQNVQALLNIIRSNVGAQVVAQHSRNWAPCRRMRSSSLLRK